MDREWNPWHGCHKYSAGCANCYVYRWDESVGRDASHVYKTRDFDLPLRRGRDGRWKLEGGTVYTCFTSDFLVEEADAWRAEAFAMMRARPDLRFFFITKRILRLASLLPDDWGEGWENVAIGCTCEDQRAADERLPEFLRLPIRERTVICEPLLGPIDLSTYLDGRIAQVVAGGESGDGARVCNYEWVLGLRRCCEETGTAFHFKQTGAKFLKDGRLYRVPRKDQLSQARKANIDLAAGELYTETT